MKNIVIGIAAFLTLFFIVAVTPAQMGMMGDRGMMRGNGMMRGQGMMNMSMIRHRYVMMNGRQAALLLCRLKIALNRLRRLSILLTRFPDTSTCQ